MPAQTINDPQVQRLIEDANRGVNSTTDEPNVIEPPETVFQLAAGYTQENGRWTKEFEVRELTGRDEEAMARISDVGRSLVAMSDRGTVRLGEDQATPQRMDTLVSGDWDTVLLAVRAATFGPEVELKPTCTSCHSEYEATVNIQTDLTIRTASQDDLLWTLKGRRHVYEVGTYTGATQRRIYDLMVEEKTLAVLNTEILHDSINRINGMPVMGRDAIRDIPLSDRRALLDSIQEHRVGPDLQGVMIKCPTCGNEQGNPLNAAALFRWN